MKNLNLVTVLNETNWEELKKIIKDTSVCDMCSEEEQESMIYYIDNIIEEKEESICKSLYFNDKTFAIRLYHFLEDLQPSNEQERDMLTKYTKLAEDLVKHYAYTVYETMVKDGLDNDLVRHNIFYLKSLGFIDSDNKLVEDMFIED